MYTITMPPLFPCKSTAPDIEYLKSIFLGLMEAFPSYSQDFFRYYLYAKEGIQEHYTTSQFAQLVINKSVFDKSFKQLHDDNSDTSFYSNKDDINDKPVLSIERSLSYHNSSAIYNNYKPKITNGVFVVDRTKVNSIQQTKVEKQLFSSEERGEAEDYCGLSQINGSCVKELSDLDRESVVDIGQAIDEQQTREGYLDANNLYCSKSISELLKSHSFDINNL